MAEKLRAEPIRAVRRLLGRLNNPGTQGNRMRSALDETALQDWINQLDPALALCGFHPFANTDRLPVPDRVIAPTDSAPAADTAQDFFQTLARLVKETQAVKSSTGNPPARKDRLEPAAAARPQKTSAAARQSDLNSTRASNPGGTANVTRSATQSQRNLQGGSALPRDPVTAATGNTASMAHNPQHGAVHNITLLQQLQTLVETLQAPASEPVRTPTSSPLPTSIPSETSRAHHAAPSLLRDLTHSLLTKSAFSGGAATSHSRRSELHEVGSSRQQITGAQPISNNSNTTDAVANSNRNKGLLPTTPLAKPGLSSAAPSRLLSASTQTAPNSSSSPTPLRPPLPFQDIGRFEVHTLADALNDYLQEQASLHGVDLS